MSSYNRNGFLSAIAPKISVYHTRGTGRDSYITTNNGGTYKKRAMSARPRSSLLFNIGYINLF